MKRITNSVVCLLVVLATGGCGQLIDIYLPNPIIERRDCTECASIVFRDAADTTGTLGALLTQVQVELVNLPADTRPVYFAGIGIDMNGNLLLSAPYGSWLVVLISESTLTEYSFVLEHDGSFTVRSPNVSESVGKLLLQVQINAGYLGATPFDSSVTLESLLALPLTDSPQALAIAQNNPEYVHSVYGLGAGVYDFGEFKPTNNHYAPSVDIDVAESVTYGGNGIRIHITKEDEWTIVDLPEDNRFGQTKDQWIVDYYGEVDRDIYNSARKEFTMPLLQP